MPDLDLTHEAVADDAAPPAPSTEPYDPVKYRENVRGHIAYAVVALFATLVVGAFVIAVARDDQSWERVNKALGVLLSPVVALVGAVTGFYYGEKAGKS